MINIDLKNVSVYQYESICLQDNLNIIYGRNDTEEKVEGAGFKSVLL